MGAFGGLRGLHSFIGSGGKDRSFGKAGRERPVGGFQGAVAALRERSGSLSNTGSRTLSTQASTRPANRQAGPGNRR